MGRRTIRNGYAGQPRLLRAAWLLALVIAASTCYAEPTRARRVTEAQIKRHVQVQLELRRQAERAADLREAELRGQIKELQRKVEALQGRHECL